MKREIRKKAINMFVGTIVTLGAISPFAIVAGQQISNIVLNANNQTRAILTSNFQLNEDNTINVGEQSNLSSNITLANPNVARSVPNGFVYTTEDGQIICVNKDNPAKLDWKASISGVDTYQKIVGIEYTPFNDTLVVLYTNGASTGNVVVSVAQFNDISQTIDGSELGTAETNASSSVKVIEYNTAGTNDDYFSASTWAISPVYKTSLQEGDNAQVTQYLIYSRGVGSETNWPKMGLYNIKDKSIQTTDRPIPYTSSKSFINNIVPFIYESSLKLIEFGIHVYGGQNILTTDYMWTNDLSTFDLNYTPGGDNYKIIQTSGMGPIENAEISEAVNAVSQSITSSVPYFYIENSNPTLKIPFIINFAGTGTSGDWFDKPLFGTIWFNPKTEAISSGISQVYLFSGNSAKSHVYAGNFNNELQIKSGLAQSTTPFLNFTFVGDSTNMILNETNNNNGVSTNDGKFIGMIEALFWNASPVVIQAYENVTPSTENNYMKFLSLSALGEVTTNSSQQQVYNDWTTTFNSNITSQGLPLLQYDADNSISTFNRNLYYSKSGTDKMFISSNSSHSSRANDYAYFAYHTAIDNTSVTTPIEAPLNGMTLDWVNQNFKIDSNPWTESSFLVNTLGMKQVNKNARFLINPDTLKIDIKNGSITFDLYSSIVYTNNGIVNCSSYGSGMFQYANHKIATITVTGFTVNDTTVKGSVDLSSYVSSSTKSLDIIPSVLSLSFTNNGGINTQVYWPFMNIIWQAICQGNVFDNLLINPSYIESSWKEDLFNNFLAKLPDATGNDTLVSYDNQKGTITLKLYVSNKYAHVANQQSTDDWYTFDVTFTGLRKIQNTTIKSNDKSTAFTNSSWSNYYIPAQGATSLPISSPSTSDITLLTISDLKSWLFDTFISPAYDAANQDNGWTASNEWIQNLSWKKALANQFGDPTDKLTINDFELSNFNFFEDNGKGAMSFTIQPKVWQKDGNVLSTSDMGLGGSSNIVDAPSATWYITGLKIVKDTTLINPQDTKISLSTAEVPNLEITSASEFLDSDDSSHTKVKNILVSLQNAGRLLINTPENWDAEQNISISNVIAKTPEGQKGELEVTFVANQVIDLASGVPKIKAKTYTVQLTGFFASEPTTEKNNPTLPGTSSKLPSDWSNSDLQDIINKNLNQLFDNPGPNMSVKVVNVEPNNADGSMKVTLEVTNCVIENDKIDPNPREFTINISGFKTQAEADKEKSDSNKKWLLVAIIAVSIVGLILVVIAGFIRKKWKERKEDIQKLKNNGNNLG